MNALRIWLCGLGGHDLIRKFEPNRVYLRCMSCPHETPGWQLKEKRTPERRMPARLALRSEA